MSKRDIIIGFVLLIAAIIFGYYQTANSERLRKIKIQREKNFHYGIVIKKPISIKKKNRLTYVQLIEQEISPFKEGDEIELSIGGSRKKIRAVIIETGKTKARFIDGAGIKEINTQFFCIKDRIKNNTLVKIKKIQ